MGKNRNPSVYAMLQIIRVLRLSDTEKIGVSLGGDPFLSLSGVAELFYIGTIANDLDERRVLNDGGYGKRFLIPLSSPNRPSHRGLTMGCLVRPAHKRG